MKCEQIRCERADALIMTAAKPSCYAERNLEYASPYRCSQSPRAARTKKLRSLWEFEAARSAGRKITFLKGI